MGVANKGPHHTLLVGTSTTGQSLSGVKGAVLVQGLERVESCAGSRFGTCGANWRTLPGKATNAQPKNPTHIGNGLYLNLVTRRLQRPPPRTDLEVRARADSVGC
eukprot:2246489-Pyramimonas_sp.AAC.1